MHLSYYLNYSLTYKEQVRVGPAGWSLVTSNPTSHMECFPHVGFIYTFISYTNLEALKQDLLEGFYSAKI